MVGYNGKVYVFGGGIKLTPTGDNWYPTNRSWEFTPATNTWREIAAMPTKRGGGFAAELGGKIYVIGGAGYHPGQKEDISISATVPHRSVATNEVYDPATNTWETRMPMNVPRNHHAGAAVNGKIYAIGGRVGWSFVGSSAVDTVEEYDPATDRWRVRSRMIYPRSGMAYGTDGKLIYTLGGEYLDSEMVGVFRSFEAYDPARDRWYSLPPMTVPRHGFAGGVIGNRFHAVSGQLQSGTGGGGPGSTEAHEAFEFERAPGATASR
jgi:N-acetylneuraminic acid mutarotase